MPEQPIQRQVPLAKRITISITPGRHSVSFTRDEALDLEHRLGELADALHAALEPQTVGQCEDCGEEHINAGGVYEDEDGNLHHVDGHAPAAATSTRGLRHPDLHRGHGRSPETGSYRGVPPSTRT
jgi:hypothetical protein